MFFPFRLQVFTKSIESKFMEDINPLYFVINAANLGYFGTETSQPFQSPMALVILVRLLCL